MKKTTPKSKFSTVISTLIIGFIGSAIWELILSPLAHLSLNKVFEGLIGISTIIGNWYAKKLATYGTTSLLLGIRTIVLCCLIFSLYTYGLNIKLFFKSYIFVFFLGIIFVIDFAFDAQFASASKVMTYNIEIVSPYVSDFEYKKLKSDFYSMNTYNEYAAIKLTLNKIAEDNNLTLK